MISDHGHIDSHLIVHLNLNLNHGGETKKKNQKMASRVPPNATAY